MSYDVNNVEGDKNSPMWFVYKIDVCLLFDSLRNPQKLKHPFRELASLTLAAQPDVPPCLSQWKAFRKILLYTKGHQHLLQSL